MATRGDRSHHLLRPRIRGRTRRDRFLLGFALAVLVAGLSPLSAGAGNFYRVAKSGVGSSGTGAGFETWTQWAVPESPSNPCGSCPDGSYGFTDQASWFIDNNANYPDAIEVGIDSGYAYSGVNGGWDNGMQPYYTTDSGAHEVNAPVSYNLHNGVAAWAASAYTDPGIGPTYIQVEDSVGTNWVQAFWYGMSCYNATPSNCLNVGQAETLYGDDWMAGGGDLLTMYYNSSQGYQYWGKEVCRADNNPPGPDDYWVSCNVNGTRYEWEPGGSGNGVFGSP